MKLIKNQTFKQIVFSLLAASCVTLIIAVIGVLKTIDSWVQDAWFQEPKALDGQIILIGIWSMRLFAHAIRDHLTHWGK